MTHSTTVNASRLTFTVTLNAQANGERVLGSIPGGFRVANAFMRFGAYGGTVTTSLGVAGTPTLFIPATASASAGQAWNIPDDTGSNVARSVVANIANGPTAASNQPLRVVLELVPNYGTL